MTITGYIVIGSIIALSLSIYALICGYVGWLKAQIDKGRDE